MVSQRQVEFFFCRCFGHEHGNIVQQKQQKQPVAREELFLQIFLIDHVELFLIPTFWPVSGILELKNPVVDDILLPQENKSLPTNSFNQICIDFEIPTDGSFQVELRYGFVAEELTLIRGCGDDTYDIKELKEENKEEQKVNRRGVTGVRKMKKRKKMVQLIRLLM